MRKHILYQALLLAKDHLYHRLISIIARLGWVVSTKGSLSVYCLSHCAALRERKYSSTDWRLIFSLLCPRYFYSIFIVFQWHFYMRFMHYFFLSMYTISFYHLYGISMVCVWEKGVLSGTCTNRWSIVGLRRRLLGCLGTLGHFCCFVVGPPSNQKGL